MKFASTLALGAALLASGAASAQAPEARPDRGARMLEMFDANRDGRVSWDEAWSFVTARFATADGDRSGGLSMQEFATLRMRRADASAPPAEHAGRMEQMRGNMFRGLDANRDAQVTLDELRPFAEARFRGMDANSDGAVTVDELPRRGHHHGRRGEAAPATR